MKTCFLTLQREGFVKSFKSNASELFERRRMKEQDDDQWKQRGHPEPYLSIKAIGVLFPCLF